MLVNGGPGVRKMPTFTNAASQALRETNWAFQERMWIKIIMEGIRKEKPSDMNDDVIK